MPPVITAYCAGCRAEREFEVPPCVEGHGDDCPDLACVECGLAMFAFVGEPRREATGRTRVA
jgi:hypothetical protein